MTAKNSTDLKADIDNDIVSGVVDGILASTDNARRTDFIDSFIKNQDTGRQPLASAIDVAALGIGGNYEFIGRDEDWPDMANVPSLGRESTTLEANKTYIVTYPADFGTRNFFVPAPGNTVIRSQRFYVNTYSGDDDFIVTDGSFSLEFIGLVYAGGGATTRIVNFRGSSPTSSFILQNGFAFNFPKTALVADAFTTSLRLYTAIGCGALEFTGTGNVNFNSSDGLFRDYDGIAIDFTGANGLEDFNFSSDSFSSTNPAAISLAFDSNTLSPTGQGVISGAIFTGDGGDIAGLDAIEERVEITGSSPSTVNTSVQGCMYVNLSTASRVISNAGQNVWNPIALPDLFIDCGLGNRFDLDTSGIMKYLGLGQETGVVEVALSVQRDGGSQPRICDFRVTESTDDGASWDEINQNAIFGLDIDNRVKPISFSMPISYNVGSWFRVEWRNNQDGTSDLGVASGSAIFLAR